MDQILQYTKTILEDLVFETYRNRLDDVFPIEEDYNLHFGNMADDLLRIYNYEKFWKLIEDIENGQWNHIGLDQIDTICLVEHVFTPISRALYISKQI